MRITSIESIPVVIPYLEPLREAILRGNPRMVAAKTTIYKVHTDQGLIGYAEGWIPPSGGLDRYIGRSPFDCLNDDTAGHLLMAFYDLAGKAMGIPVWKLFGPLQKDEVLTAYWSHAYTPEMLAAEVHTAVKKGFTVHKVKSRRFRDPVEQIAAMSEAAPEDYRIVMDANETWATPQRTIDFACELRKYPQITTLEEPIPRWNLEGYRYLREKLDFHFAIHAEGTKEQVLSQLNHCDAFVLENQGLGRTTWLTAGLAEAAGQSIWMEYALYTGISYAFQMHQASVMPNCEMCITLAFITEDDLIIEPMALKDGHMAVPMIPGLGVTLDEAALDRYRVD